MKDYQAGYEYGIQLAMDICLKSAELHEKNGLHSKIGTEQRHDEVSRWKEACDLYEAIRAMQELK